MPSPFPNFLAILQTARARRFQDRLLFREQWSSGKVEEAFGFFQEELRLGEGFVADVLPPHHAVAVDQEGAVQGHFFEVIVSAIRLEHVELFV
jgi:hypothetical protein